MTVVVDASTIVAALVDNGPDGRWAEDQLARSGRLAAPEIMQTEVANVLRRAEFAGQIESAIAALAFADLRRLAVDIIPFPLLAPRMWELRHNLSSYDAAYVAGAEAIGAPVATLDIRLAEAPGPTCPFLTP